MPPSPPLPAAPPDRRAFERAAAAHRRELLVHCYRLVGSAHDAEELVQETFLRAWRGFARFDGRASVRHWLYRIATNACLDALAQRKRARRVFPQDLGGPTRRMPSMPPSSEIPWIEPLPDDALDRHADAAPGPAAQYELRETVRLAFIGATQRLPARQRAVLLLRDVLGWSAAESAQALKLTTTAVNSALQRARRALAEGLSREEIGAEAAGDQAATPLAEAYVRAWEQQDLDGLVSLLAKGASLTMPPWAAWYSGRAQLRAVFAWAWRRYSQGGAYRMVPIRANAQTGFGTYLRPAGQARFQAHVLQVLTLRGGRIGQITLFIGPGYFAQFGLPAELAD